MAASDETQYSDEYWMRYALEQATLAADKNEVPVGAVVVVDNMLVASAYNRPIEGCDPTAHAEILALREAAEKLGNYRLLNASLYVTLEPCTMCVGAMVHARIARLVYGACEYKTGAVESAFQLLTADAHNHTIDVQSGVLEVPCREILQAFFKRRRDEKRKLKAQSQ